MPTTSPAKASSASARSCAKKNCGLESDMFLPVRTSFAFMPRTSLPEHSRAKAMRSRWLGSMLAWILNTKAVIAGSSAATSRLSAGLRARRRREIGKAVEEVADAEILERGAEEHRRQVALAEGGEIEGPAGVAR